MDSTDRMEMDGDRRRVSTRPLSAREVAAALGINERTVRRAIARGDLPAIKIAGIFRIDPADVARYRRRIEMPASPDRSPPKPDQPT